MELKINPIWTNNKSSRNGNEVEGIILHFTNAGSIEGSIKWFLDSTSKSSAHYLIERDGRVVQMVKEAEAAWHAGSKNTTPQLKRRGNLNLWTIGIELCNWGPILLADRDEEINVDGVIKKREVGKFYTWVDKWTYPYRGASPEDHVIETDVGLGEGWPETQEGLVRWWEPYSGTQVGMLVQLMAQIVSNCPQVKRECVARHQDVDPTRKLDTGPVLAVDKILDSVFGVKEDKPDKFEDILSIEQMQSHFGADRDVGCNKSFTSWIGKFFGK